MQATQMKSISSTNTHTRQKRHMNLMSNYSRWDSKTSQNSKADSKQNAVIVAGNRLHKNVLHVVNETILQECVHQENHANTTRAEVKKFDYESSSEDKYRRNWIISACARSWGQQQSYNYTVIFENVLRIQSFFCPNQWPDVSVTGDDSLAS